MWWRMLVLAISNLSLGAQGGWAFIDDLQTSICFNQGSNIFQENQVARLKMHSICFGWMLLVITYASPARPCDRHRNLPDVVHAGEKIRGAGARQWDHSAPFLQRASPPQAYRDWRGWGGTNKTAGKPKHRAKISWLGNESCWLHP